VTVKKGMGKVQSKGKQKGMSERYRHVTVKKGPGKVRVKYLTK
jgi:hypothetical protein